MCFEYCPIGTHNSLNISLCEKNIDCNFYYNDKNIKKCIDYIPEGFYLKGTIYNIIDECNIKCKNCSLESNKNNLCISCNASYYPIYNDNLN